MISLKIKSPKVFIRYLVQFKESIESLVKFNPKHLLRLIEEPI